MTNFAQLSRRERQIMNVVFARRKATVQDICATLPDAPTPTAVERMLAVLQEKGHVKCEKKGREYVYFPRLH
jgi:predicted transcriptional regulator